MNFIVLLMTFIFGFIIFSTLWRWLSPNIDTAAKLLFYSLQWLILVGANKLSVLLWDGLSEIIGKVA